MTWGDFVLDGDPAPLPKKGAEPPNFRPMFVVAKRLDGSIILGMEVGLRPGNLMVLDGDPDPSPKKGQSPRPNFWPIYIVAKPLDAPRCHLVRS